MRMVRLVSALSGCLSSRSTIRALNTQELVAQALGGCSAPMRCRDSFGMPWNVFLKYNNGRFFVNLEYGIRNIKHYYNYANAARFMRLVQASVAPLLRRSLQVDG